MPIKGKQHADGCYAVTIVTAVWIQLYVLWRNTVHAWVMNIHYQTWIAQGRFTKIILTPSKQWGVCDNG